MLSFLAQGSPTTIGLLVVCFALVLAFEFSNGFHDTANAVATLKPLYAVVWSGLMNMRPGGCVFSAPPVSGSGRWSVTNAS
jgi:phosphate/sulfate permease